MVITTLAAHGTMIAIRTQRRPGKFLSRNCASASEIATVMTTTETTQMKVLRRMPGISGRESTVM
ncbi:hypothetical protein ACRAWC_17855 [Leifsonia sp. L25]|uniref:hypothetical protein n=1 Tax=Leifsonia sp. L25 TaxID=3423957 RepID=UPI003D69AC31